jgi:hypothetical protein
LKHEWGGFFNCRQATVKLVDLVDGGGGGLRKLRTKKK